MVSFELCPDVLSDKGKYQWVMITFDIFIKKNEIKKVKVIREHKSHIRVV